MLILLLYFETRVYQVEYQTENDFFFHRLHAAFQTLEPCALLKQLCSTKIMGAYSKSHQYRSHSIWVSVLG